MCGPCEAALPRLSSCCESCAVALPFPGICGHCQRRAPAFDRAVAAFDYRFPVDRVVHRFKYSADLAMGRWLSLQLADRVRREPLPDLLVAPPLTAARLRERGFNQALEIAKAVGRRLGVRCDLTGLAKVRETLPQPGLGRARRRANLRRAFRCDLALEGRSVAIVDDVMTTGATADALARVLKAAGAAHVSVWATARTPDPASLPLPWERVGERV
jgi:ComF family protein